MSDARTSDVSDESSRPPRTIVLCFDGTSGQYDSMNTNVVRFFGLLSKDNQEKQVAYYQAGIGTYFAPGIVSPLWSWLASLLDEAFAWYLDAHVMSGYEFLMDNYRAGDKICLFGFSRGAFTARALAGMLHKVGLLGKGNLEQVNFAYKAYKRTDKEGIELAAGFKQTFSKDVKIEFVGVWDTVQSTGILVDRRLPFTDSNTAIKIFRHALSLDERRARFRPNLYHWPAQVDAPGDLPDFAAGKFTAIKSSLKRLSRKSPRIRPEQTLVDSGPSTDTVQREGQGDEVFPDGAHPKTEFAREETLTCTDVLEVWFAGCHSDIGGGNVPDDVEVSLAQIALHWMVEQVIQSQCGILFDDEELARIGFPAPTPSPHPSTKDLPRAGSDIETTRDATDAAGSVAHDLPAQDESDQPTADPGSYPESSDATAPLFDELNLNRMWWLLEIMPTFYEWQNRKGVWRGKWRINLGSPRTIPFEKPKFHHSVKERMDYKPLKYKPRAIYAHDEVYV